jgi:anti-sigma factor RsiW
MNCDESEILIHALLDGELDAGHARDVENHLAACPACAEKLKSFRALRQAMTAAKLKETAPAALRGRLETMLGASPAGDAAVTREAGAARGGRTATGRSPQAPSWLPSWLPPWPLSWLPSWRSFLGGFSLGTALSAAVAASLAIAIIRGDEGRQLTGEFVSAHVRSLQPGHLTDVETSDQHTVKPWFNGKLDVAPPVIDLTAQGFTLIGGRLDYVDGEPVASIVYRRRKHVINLFVAQQLGDAVRGNRADTVQGFNVRHWRARGLEYWAISDIAPEELDEFVQKIMAATAPAAGAS